MRARQPSSAGLRVDKGDWPWPSELTYRSGIAGIPDQSWKKGEKGLETVSEGKDTGINACWKESGARGRESQGKQGLVTGRVEGDTNSPLSLSNKGHQLGGAAPADRRSLRPPGQDGLILQDGVLHTNRPDEKPELLWLTPAFPVHPHQHGLEGHPTHLLLNPELCSASPREAIPQPGLTSGQQDVQSSWGDQERGSCSDQ